MVDPHYFIDRIRRIGLGGSTAIADGVLKGRGEVLTYMEPRRLNRIVLLSDGQANVGPSRVEDFIRLGKGLLPTASPSAPSASASATTKT